MDDEMSEPIIDQETIANLIGMTGEDFLQELVEAYLEDSPFLFKQMRQALAAQDAEAFRRSAHSLKTSSASLGALGFAEHARELEMMGKNRRLSVAEAGVDSLELEFAKVEAAFKELAYGA
jgi:HPt (histidine-containing phosphotransfer) domain-containing protein